MPKLTLTGKDLIAAILLIGCFVLRYNGINHLTEYVIAGIALVYLGIEHIPRPRSGP